METSTHFFRHGLWPPSRSGVYCINLPYYKLTTKGAWVPIHNKKSTSGHNEVQESYSTAFSASVTTTYR